MPCGPSTIWGVGASPNFWQIFLKRYKTPQLLDLESFTICNMTSALGVGVLICRRSVTQVKYSLGISAIASRIKALPVKTEVTLRVIEGVTQGQKTKLFPNFGVLQGEVSAHIRMTLKVIVKVTKGQIPVLERCQNSLHPKGVWESWIFFAEG